jgi:hypothetical protein
MNSVESAYMVDEFFCQKCGIEFSVANEGDGYDLYTFYYTGSELTTMAKGKVRVVIDQLENNLDAYGDDWNEMLRALIPDVTDGFNSSMMEYALFLVLLDRKGKK